jgi:cyclic pyranopterin phosphate synthase
MLTHVDEKTQMPTMVDVSEKKVTMRTATARTLLQLPPELKPHLQGNELTLKKGPVFQTAIIAGTMAAKKTHEVIPFCHQIPIESCKLNIAVDQNLLVTIDCTVKTTSKTGVEMEALSGATTAALTVYDMCKAVSHNIVIRETRLLTKTGGKRTILDRPLYGLVLTGGKSERMKQDKALINYKGQPHARYIYDILRDFCEDVYLSAKPNQWNGTVLEELPQLADSVDARGPISGILSAFAKHPDANWLIVACDLVHFNKSTVETLLFNYKADAVASAYKNSEKGFAEPLCALYTPQAQRVFAEALNQEITCPVKVLKSAKVELIEQGGEINLANINTVEEFTKLKSEMHI